MGGIENFLSRLLKKYPGITVYCHTVIFTIFYYALCHHAIIEQT